MNGLHVIVRDENDIYNTFKENHKVLEFGDCFFWFSTFFMWNRHMGTDPEELLILVNAANKFSTSNPLPKPSQHIPQSPSSSFILHQDQKTSMKLNITLSDNFQDNLNTVSELAKEDVSLDFFQTPFFRKWFASQDLTELVPFYLVSNYISNVNFLTSVWGEIPFDIFQNYQNILMKFELYSTAESCRNWMRDSMSYQTYLHMISHFYDEEGFQRTLDIYNDTVNQLSKLISRRENEPEKITKPKRWRLQEFHDHMSHLYLEATTENRPHPTEFIPTPVTIDSWKVYEPSCSLDLAMWGRRVRNCVMSYEDKIFRKQSAIILIEENEKPTYTAELDYSRLKEGRIEFKQLVGLNNRSSDLDAEKRNVVLNLIESALQK